MAKVEAKPKELKLERGSKQWHDLRRKCVLSHPGKYSSLYFFNEKILGHGPLVPMTHRAHYAMCLFAEGMTGIPEIDSARVKMSLVPRGIGKSTLLTKGQSIHEFCKGVLLPSFRDYAVGIANEKGDNANAFLAMIKEEFETNDLLRTLFPELLFDDWRETTWSASRIVLKRNKPNPTNPSVLATGTTGTVTGVHMSTWRLDDLISQNAAENALRGSFSEIEATNRWIQRVQPLLRSPKRDPIHIIGTRWWEGDSYEFCEEFWGHGEPKEEFVWTLKLPGGETQSITLYKRGEIAVFKRPAIDENGRSIFPERYTLEDLQMMQQEDPAFFAGQYLLEPAAGGANEFEPEWLKYYELEGSQIRFRGQDGRISFTSARDLVCFISVDPAISDSHGAARSAVPVVGTNGTEVFLLEDWAERGIGMFDLAHRVVDFYLRYRPRYIFIETIVYQRAFMEGLESVARDRGCPEIMGAVQEIRSHQGKSKDFRIYGLEPFFKSGRFYVHRSHTNFISEYTTFPRGALRDVIDAVSFQTDAWERIAQSHSYGSSTNPQGRMAAERAAMDRVRQAWGSNSRR